MSFCLERIIIKNRAPFEDIDLTFKENTISVLTAFNGKGKTTILSYIIDAWVEFTKSAYSNTYAGKENSYYRVSSPLYDIDVERPSLVYVRFKYNEKNVDYLDSRNGGSKEWYESAIFMEDRIPYSDLESDFKKGRAFKFISKDFQKEENVKSIFNHNITTYFPAYRFEMPNFLNEKYKQNDMHNLEMKYNGSLNTPLEVTSDIHDIANWLLDVVLDSEVNAREIQLPDGTKARVPGTDQIIWLNTKKILEGALISKFPNRNVRFGIGTRRNGGSRLAVMEIVNDGEDKTYCPSLFNLSSGELAIISIFAEILKQGDITYGALPMEQFHGIVLIDEVDKHLHIQLQKEILPLLFNLFPNIQFIVSSHSPFLNMGLAEMSISRTVVYDLDNKGIESSPTTNKVYEDAYNSFLNEKNKYVEMYNKLVDEVRQSKKPLVITEGKTDAKHLKAAMQRLGIKDLDIDFFDPSGLQWGDSQLQSMVEQLSKVRQNYKIIGIFDRDSDKYVTYATDDTHSYKCLGNNVYVFAIPLVNNNEYGDKISIEHYYHKADLLTPDMNNRRIFLGKEFYESGNSIDGKYQTRTSKIQNKVSINGVIDEKVYLASDLEQETSIACTKDSFAESVLSNADYTKDFDLSNFNQIFDVIRLIIREP